MKYPSLEEVESASRGQLAEWYRFLPSPGFSARGETNYKEIMNQEKAILDSVTKKLKGLGGFPPGLSKTLKAPYNFS